MDRRLLFSLLILASFLVPVGSQQPPAQPSAPKQQNTPREEDQEVVRITTNLVQVDVVVTKDGKQVTDLKPEDFELFEDGHPQTITHFSYISNVPANASSRTPASSKKDNGSVIAPAVVRPHDVRRIVAFVVDDLGMSLESMGQARRQLRKFVDEQLQPNDLVAIVRTGGDVGALQQFTTDKRLLDSAIEHLKWNQCSRVGLNVFKPVTSPFLRQSENVEPCGGRSQLLTMQTVRFVLQGMRELPGRKSMVFFSDSLPIENQETEIQNTGPAGTDQTGDDAGSSTDPFDSSTSYEALLRKIAEMAIRASVVIYAVDTRGLQYTGLTAADAPSGSGQSALRAMQNTMNTRSAALLAGRAGEDLIARQTGGYLVRNSNDFGLQRVMEDQRGYYLLGYRPADETFNRRFHHLKARVKRSGLTLRTRAGFYGVSEDEVRPTELTPGDELKRALMSPFGSNEIAVRLTTFFANEATPGSLLRSFLYLNAHDLTFAEKPDGTHEAAFDLSSIVFGDNGTVVSRQDETATLRLRGPAYERAEREGIVYGFDMPVKISGAFQLRVAVRDKTSARIGAAGQFVQVPNLRKDQLALSGIVVHNQLSTQPSSTAKPEADDITAGPAVRQFHQGSNLIAVYAVYNALLDPTSHLPRLTTQMRILRDGKPIFTADPIPIDATGQTDLQRVINGCLLRMGPELSPGDYVLQIIVEDQLGKEKGRTATQWIDFEVIK